MPRAVHAARTAPFAPSMSPPTAAGPRSFTMRPVTRTRLPCCARSSGAGRARQSDTDRETPLIQSRTPTALSPDTADTAAAETSFQALGLHPLLLENVARAGYETPTPIQSQAIPPVMDGRDLLAGAPTGTGKTAAFTLPILHKLAPHAKGNGRAIRALVLCPTRELATQIADSFDVYGRNTGVRHVCVYGGVGQTGQVKSLRQGVDVVIATPGRLMDLMGQGHIKLGQVETLVLDEADRMLDMGFVPAVRKIAATLPTGRQTLMFSATVPPTIAKLVAELMTRPVRVEVLAETASADAIEQGIYFVRKADKPALLSHLIERHGVNCGIVFSRTKHGADRLAKRLAQDGIQAVAIHGNRSQSQRQRALDGFKSGRVPILVATDVAARGIDVDGVTHVINYDLTHEPETYVHRIGRTGRAGASGVALSFCDHEERGHLKDIQKMLGRELPVVTDHPYPDGAQRVELKPSRKPRGPSGRQPAASFAPEPNGGMNAGSNVGFADAPPSAPKPPRADHPLDRPGHGATGHGGTANGPGRGNKGPGRPKSNKSRPGGGVVSASRPAGKSAGKPQGRRSGRAGR